MATGITNLVSYDLNGVKESFANWISNISPTDTPFVSMTGKEAITNKYFQWQHDSLGVVDQSNAQAEGSDAVATTLTPTKVGQNVTQILRKVVQVSDTADSLSSYGRGSELAYQMEKAGAEIKRDLEWAFLHNTTGKDVTEPGIAAGTGTSGIGGGANTGTGFDAATGAQVRITKGFQGLVNTDNAPSAVTAGEQVKVVVAGEKKATDVPKDTYLFTENDIFGLTRNLYLVGAQPNIIMYHPTHAKTFSSLMEGSGNGVNRQRMFDGAEDTKINTYVSTLVDPLGQEFKLIPNRFMPQDAIYVFDPSDWTQMVLRAPQRTKLAKTGSYEKWMIEMEVGLRHRNPYASGVLTLTKGTATA